MTPARLAARLRSASILTSALALFALAGCAGVRPESPAAAIGAALFQDAHFSAPAAMPSAQQVVALSEPMRRHLDERLAPLVRRHGVRQGLVEALYSGDQLRLEYDAAYTRNASEAFASRSGNCLSLVLMTAAFARALDLEVTYNRVSVDEQWRLAGDLMLAAGHVNLTLGKRRLDRRSGYDASGLLTIDFLPAAELERQRSEPIDEATVIGMYMNNRAAESLADGQLDAAYWWARAAVEQAPREVAGYNTLAVTYLRRGLDRAAEQVLRAALAGAPDNTRLLGNLVQLLQRQQRLAEAQPLARRLEAIEPVAPYRDYHLGQRALREGRYRDAVALFKRELVRAPEQSEAHAGLARAWLGLGDTQAAREHLLRARDLSTSRGEAALYAAKLGRLAAPAVR